MEESDKYRYWKDGDLEIRSCTECHFSQFKSPNDGQWIIYFTKERTSWFFDQLTNGNTHAHCKTCTGRDKPFEHNVPVCNWCEKSEIVRECGPNYICFDCEKKETDAARPVILTSPVRNSFFIFDETKEQ